MVYMPLFVGGREEYTLYIPPYHTPGYTPPGIHHPTIPPWVYLTLPTPLGTPTPLSSAPAGRALGSTLRLITVMRRREPCFSQRVLGRKGDLCAELLRLSHRIRRKDWIELGASPLNPLCSRPLLEHPLLARVPDIQHRMGN